MSGRLLDFKNYVGGSDNVQVIELFPDTQQMYQYAYDVDITNYSFTLDYQTLIVDEVAYSRTDGLPNFANSNIIGYFANVTPSSATYVTDRNNAAGTVNVTIPSGRYAGQMLPNARANVPITIFSVTWTDSEGTNPVTSSHRWAILERYRPGTNSEGDPTLDSNFIKYGVGAITGFTDNAVTDANRLEGTYTVTGLSSGNGVEAEFVVDVSNTGVTSVNITNRGNSYRVSETIELVDADLGAGGGADITITVSSVS